MPWGEKEFGKVLRVETKHQLSCNTKLALTLIKIFVSWQLRNVYIVSYLSVFNFCKQDVIICIHC